MQAAAQIDHIDVADVVARAQSDRLAMARLLAVAGHDLKQPLQVALTALSFGRAHPDAASRSHYTAMAIGALERLALELEDLARGSQTPDCLSPKTRVVPVCELLDGVMADWRNYAEVFGVRLQVLQSRAFIETDPAMLRTILRNLVGNALKYSRKGGRVLVGCRPRGSALRIEVHDTGCGIGTARLGRIFQAFERFDDTGAVSGLGLGLHIVQRTADVLRVPIEVRSTEQVGSIFAVEVPVPSWAVKHRPCDAVMQLTA